MEVRRDWLRVALWLAVVASSGVLALAEEVQYHATYDEAADTCQTTPLDDGRVLVAGGVDQGGFVNPAHCLRPAHRISQLATFLPSTLAMQ